VARSPGSVTSTTVLAWAAVAAGLLRSRPRSAQRDGGDRDEHGADRGIQQEAAGGRHCARALAPPHGHGGAPARGGASARGAERGRGRDGSGAAVLCGSVALPPCVAIVSCHLDRG
jgi:hypothetical protein